MDAFAIFQLPQRRKSNEYHMLVTLLKAHMIVSPTNADVEALQAVLQAHERVTGDVNRYVEMGYRMALILQDPLIFGLPTIRSELGGMSEFGCHDDCIPDIV
jgi:hypothetical protein